MVPKPGIETVIITDKPNIIDARGKNRLDVKEGEASIVKPEGTSYKLVARVQTDEWPAAAK